MTSNSGEKGRKKRRAEGSNAKLEAFFYTFESQILPRGLRRSPARIALSRGDAGSAFRISVSGWEITSTPWKKEREGG